MIDDTAEPGERTLKLLPPSVHPLHSDQRPVTPEAKSVDLLPQWRARGNLSQLEKLPVETLQYITGSLLTPGGHAKLSAASRALHFKVGEQLLDRKCLIFAGTDYVFEEGGASEIGDDGLNLRAYPPVLDALGEPIIGANGEVVRQNSMVHHPLIRNMNYFAVPPDQLPPVLDQAGNQITDAEGRVVREMPVLNANYYADALNEIKSLKLRYKYEALNLLTRTFRENPVPELLPVWNEQLRTVDFPPELESLLSADNLAVREWAVERVEDFSKSNSVHFETADALLTVDGYMPTLMPPERRETCGKVRLGERHKDMFFHRDRSVHLLADTMLRQFCDLHTPRITRPIKTTKTQNEVETFRKIERNNQVIEVTVPDRFDTWLSPRPLWEQRGGLVRLVTMMKTQHDSLASQIAIGFAKYLLRNSMQLPPGRLQALLEPRSSHGGTLGVLSEFQSVREIFTRALSQPAPNGKSIPADVIAGLDQSMRIMNRNDWALDCYASTKTRTSSVERQFKNWASVHGVDLAGIAQSGNIEDLNRQVPQYLPQSGQQTNPQQLKSYFTWLIRNAHTAPQG